MLEFIFLALCIFSVFFGFANLLAAFADEFSWSHLGTAIISGCLVILLWITAVGPNIEQSNKNYHQAKEQEIALCKKYGGDFLGYSKDAHGDICMSSKTNQRVIVPNI